MAVKMRIFISIAILLGLLMSCTLLVPIYPMLLPCKYESVSRTVSPDRKRVAILYSGNCGATTGYSYNVSIVAVNKALKGPGNILVADHVTDYSDRLKPTWQGNKAITVPIPSGARVFSKNNTVRDIRVTFQQL
jgi:hypothetical protein